jgi:hypothetical protein
VVTTAALTGWLLSVMLSTQPPGTSTVPDARESAQQGRTRYAAIAKAIAEVSNDPRERPLYTGPYGRAKTAALLLAIAYHESNWRRDVDLGLGKQATRRYRCMMQIAFDKPKTPEGWTARDLVTNRELCFRRGLHILQRGQRFCGSRFVQHYASGNCKGGDKAVALRMRTYQGWLRKSPYAPVSPAARREPQRAPQRSR